MNDRDYMERAIRLARKGEGRVSPNPMVGAVIVKKGIIIGEGYHRQFGGPHAEIQALHNAVEPVDGATWYVTLEPCSHHGKTPPCVDAIIASRPARVVAGVQDPNPVVGGKGLEKLRKQGIDVTLGVLEEECRELNETFFTFMTTHRPFVTLKYAQTADGRIAAGTGDSRWVSSEPSRRFAHMLRSHHDAILVGVDTVIHDDPELTVRLVRGRNPLRIVLDSTLRIPDNARILRDQDQANTVVVAAEGCSEKRRRKLLDRGVETITVPAGDSGINPETLLMELGSRSISSLLVEGGSKVITSFLKEHLADRLVIITAPKILGAGIEAVGDLDSTSIDDALQLSLRRITRKGDDVILDYRMKRRD
ncbi:MAG: bifunctional diaminohydroxyphosphoribosylaminopyrimidine deaminase/5-amino-6-(5-phosphoribosylamino)uracil reductase RibD [Deltaproteobacteria bacterium]|nr:bifunctional diaminohydroxyphosphoribosylaminopyrimidine deaminase/5-amino-6-(5-phosphoribosylamino)uracil reductase RibD [Deltaproteobacteria bacterium]